MTLVDNILGRKKVTRTIHTPAHVIVINPDPENQQQKQQMVSDLLQLDTRVTMLEYEVELLRRDI